jgi:hypothetical protein
MYFYKEKKFNEQNVSLILRNVILGVGIEVTVSYFLNRVYIYHYPIINVKNFHINVLSCIMLDLEL